MKLKRKNFFVTILVLLFPIEILLFTGCERRPGKSSRYVGWKISSINTKVPGIDNGSAYFGGYDEGTGIIVWINSMSCKLEIKDSWDKTRNCVKYAGHIESINHKKLNIEGFVKERMKGSVTINEQDYDLANGSLFLINIRSAQPKIAQIEQDIYDITPKTRNKLVEKIPEIREFFEVHTNE